MRSDAIGLFWQDLPRVRAGANRVAAVMPPIPDTGWVAPSEFPNLRAAKALSIDTETYDPELTTKGPGWARGSGHIVGISVSVPELQRWYFPMRHTIEPETNLNPEHVLAWAKDNLTDDRSKVGANLTYDVGWLRQEGINVGGLLYDVEFAEALLNESETVALEDLGERYLGRGKTSEILYEWCSQYYMGAPSPKQRANIYRAPPRLVGPYAESDASLPFEVMEKQWPLLYQQGLLHLFSMECRLIRLMIDMRYAGVTIDLQRAEDIKKKLQSELVLIDQKLEDMVGFEVNTNSAASMASAFDSLGLTYGRTKTDKPSFTKNFLKGIEHPIGDLIREKKEHEHLIGTFIDSYLLNSHVNGKVHGSFNQLRGDEEGTRSGRYSATNPNLQNIPARTETGKLVRTCFVPDTGHINWIKADYSQIEYRGLAHFAVGPGSDSVRAMYNQDPNVDFHEMIKQLILKITGQNLDRPLVKNVNFGTVYGMGEPGLARYLKLELKKAKELLAAIHRGAPFLKATMEATMQEAARTGYITTILGRRSHFDLWVPGYYSKHKITPLPWNEAIKVYANPQRASTHKALNRRLQGSAADLLKAAMLICYENGMFKEVGVPRLTVHDELDFSNPGGVDPIFRQIRHIMENAIQFSVPVLVGWETGPSWGEVHE